MDIEKVGEQISFLRRKKDLTQNELGQRLGVSFQAVSKWERGETLPDTAILPDLADILETTVDYILSGGEKAIRYNGRITVADAKEGIRCLDRMGELLGRENPLYRHAVEGINEKMNTDIEPAFRDEKLFECFAAEAVIQCVTAGKYADLTDIENGFSDPHFRDIVLEYCRKYGIR